MRTHLLTAALAGIGLVVSTLAFADDTKPATAAQPVAATDPGDQVTCHPVVHEGMVLRKSECHTQREWDRMLRESQRSLSQWQQQSLSGPVH